MKKIAFFLIGSMLLTACSSNFSEEEKEAYKKKGVEISKASFNELSSQLMAQMKEGGPVKAIPFCKLEAKGILQELSEKYDAQVKRSSDLLRSCKIEPTERELEVIYAYKDSLSKNKDLKPIVEIDTDQKKHFYAPIIVQAKCLVCHGEVNKTMAVSTDSIIKSYYPFDIATGYKEGDVRGVWSITFNK